MISVIIIIPFNSVINYKTTTSPTTQTKSHKNCKRSFWRSSEISKLYIPNRVDPKGCIFKLHREAGKL